MRDIYEIIEINVKRCAEIIVSAKGRALAMALIVFLSIEPVVCSTIWDVSESASSNLFEHFKVFYNHWAWIAFVIALIYFLIGNKQNPQVVMAGKIAIGVLIGYIVVNAGYAVFNSTMQSIVEDFGGSASQSTNIINAGK